MIGWRSPSACYHLDEQIGIPGRIDPTVFAPESTKKSLWLALILMHVPFPWRKEKSLEICSWSSAAVDHARHGMCDSCIWFLCDGYKACMVAVNRTAVRHDAKLVKIIHKGKKMHGLILFSFTVK